MWRHYCPPRGVNNVTSYVWDAVLPVEEWRWKNKIKKSTVLPIYSPPAKTDKSPDGWRHTGVFMFHCFVEKRHEVSAETVEPIDTSHGTSEWSWSRCDADTSRDQMLTWIWISAVSRCKHTCVQVKLRSWELRCVSGSLWSQVDH